MSPIKTTLLTYYCFSSLAGRYNNEEDNLDNSGIHKKKEISIPFLQRVNISQHYKTYKSKEIVFQKRGAKAQIAFAIFFIETRKA